MSNNFVAMLIIAWAISTQVVVFTQASRVIESCSVEILND